MHTFRSLTYGLVGFPLLRRCLLRKGWLRKDRVTTRRGASGIRAEVHRVVFHFGRGWRLWQFELSQVVMLPRCTLCLYSSGRKRSPIPMVGSSGASEGCAVARTTVNLAGCGMLDVILGVEARLRWRAFDTFCRGEIAIHPGATSQKNQSKKASVCITCYTLWPC